MVRQLFALLPLALVLHAAPGAAQSASPSTSKGASLPAMKQVPVSQRMAPLELSPAQLALADRVVLGKMPCELSAHVLVRPDPRGAGMFVLELGKQRFFMTPVLTSTGAIRLEDPDAGAVWLQLGNKSMLMSQKLGKRLADACVSPDQALVAQALERNPAPSLLDAPAVLQATAAPEGAVRVIAVTESAQ
jgi:hypothetical protein